MVCQEGWCVASARFMTLPPFSPPTTRYPVLHQHYSHQRIAFAIEVENHYCLRAPAKIMAGPFSMCSAREPTYGKVHAHNCGSHELDSCLEKYAG
jgi:hypothetical protein